MRTRIIELRRSRSLSGGNQQKVAIAAAIARRPSLLALEEPTRGVDVGSKAEIYRILRDYAAQGNGVLVYCTEVPEVYELADRVVVVDAGRAGAPMDVRALRGPHDACRCHRRASSTPPSWPRI